MKRLSLNEYLTRLARYADNARAKNKNLFIPDTNVYDLVCLASKTKYGDDSMQLTFPAQNCELDLQVYYNWKTLEFYFSVDHLNTKDVRIAFKQEHKKITDVPECVIEDMNSDKLCDAIKKINSHIMPTCELTDQEVELMLKLFGIRQYIQTKNDERLVNMWKA